MRKTRKQYGWLAAALTLALGTSAQAAIYDWNLTGPGDNGNWTTAANWTYFCCGADLGYPQAIWDSARVNTDSANNYTVTVNTFVSDLANKLGGLTLDNTGGGTANLVVNGSGSLAGHDIDVGNGGHIQVDGAGATLQKAQSLNFFGDGGTFTVENGATFFGANSTFGIYIGGGRFSNHPGGDLNTLTVRGAGTLYQANAGAHQTRIGDSKDDGTDPAIGNEATVSDGAGWIGNVYVGVDAGAELNTFTVSGAGPARSGRLNVGIGANASDNSITLTDGVDWTMGFGASVSTTIGSGSGADNNSLNIGAAGGAAVMVTGQYNDFVGNAGGSGNSITLENATWLRNGNFWAMWIGNGAGSDNNSIVINDGGFWDGGSRDSVFVGDGAATGNKLVVNAGGQISAVATLQVGRSGATGNSLIVDGGSISISGPPWLPPRLEINPGNTLQVGIDAAGTGLISVAGSVTLGGSDLVATVDAGNPPAAGTHTYLIIANDASDAVSGTFASATSGSAYLTVDSVNYTADTGNDVAITVTYSPPPVCDCPALTAEVLAAVCAAALPTSTSELAAFIDAAIAAAFTAAGCPLDDPCADEIRAAYGL